MCLDIREEMLCVIGFPPMLSNVEVTGVTEEDKWRFNDEYPSQVLTKT
jgi:hypothetical protein